MADEPVTDECGDLSGLAWGWCLAMGKGAESRDKVLETVGTLGAGAQATVGGMVSGAQKTAGKLPKLFGGGGPSPGTIVAYVGLGIVGLGLADIYLTGGAGAASLRSAFASTGGRRK